MCFKAELVRANWFYSLDGLSKCNTPILLCTQYFILYVQFYSLGIQSSCQDLESISPVYGKFRLYIVRDSENFGYPTILKKIPALPLEQRGFCKNSKTTTHNFRLRNSIAVRYEYKVLATDYGSMSPEFIHSFF